MVGHARHDMAVYQGEGVLASPCDQDLQNYNKATFLKKWHSCTCVYMQFTAHHTAQLQVQAKMRGDTAISFYLSFDDEPYTVYDKLDKL